jgi:hypothetical protein
VRLGARVTPIGEQLETLDLGVTWNPNAPEAFLLSDDSGKTVLALNPHRDDTDRRCVVLVWSRARSACLDAPNDEAISGHRLYERGLSNVLWVGLVRDSETVVALALTTRVHPYRDPTRFDSRHGGMTDVRSSAAIGNVLNSARPRFTLGGMCGCQHRAVSSEQAIDYL